MRLRAAERDDAPAIARIHVDAWRHAYRGIMPEQVLAGLSTTERAERWTTIIDGSHERTSTVLVAESRDELTGFACTATGDSPELSALYVDPSRIGTGVGHALHESAIAQVAGQDLNLWVVEKNTRAVDFYRDHGWAVAAGRIVETWGGESIDVVEMRRRASEGRPRERSASL